MNPAQRALWYIESHLAEPMTLDEIAAELRPLRRGLRSRGRQRRLRNLDTRARVARNAGIPSGLLGKAW
ncbi:hypothetical protein XH96_09675 [Bradyrhizobium sp. CCBAU 51765]|nr:hypothetical protein XH96_09675 [Bradyrhizobium sp. CCBAU 51765]